MSDSERALSEKHQADPKNANSVVLDPNPTIAELEWLLSAPEGYLTTEADSVGKTSVTLGPRLVRSATRLTGETPRTDAAVKVAHSAGFPPCEPEVVHASFARQIESELNAARHAIQWFVVADWPKGYDAWPAELKKAIVAATDR